MHPPIRFLLCLAVSATVLSAQETATSAASERLPRAEVEKLVGPIALYPDQLVALILPATTRPSDIVLAARYLERGGDPLATDGQPWEPSVKALAHYREIITLLDEDLAWTSRLGDCFFVQPEDVMGAIQTLRRRAFDAGLLASTAEHEVVVENGEIRIVPARAEYVHIPRYDPEILHVGTVRYQPYPWRPFLTFSAGYGVGSWLCYEPDWLQPSIRIVRRPSHWYRSPDWRWRHAHRPAMPGHTWTRWSAPPRHHHRPRQHVHQPDNRGSAPRFGRPDDHMPTADGRNGRHRRDRWPDRNRPDASARVPVRPGEDTPMASIPGPVVPDLTPVVPDLTPVSPAVVTTPSLNERRPRREPRFDRDERPNPPSRPRPEYRSTPPAPAPSASPTAAPPPASPGRAERANRESAERSSRPERRDRAEDDSRREREQR